MLATGTLLLAGLALWTAVDGARFVLWRRSLNSGQRLAMRQRLTFLLGFALVLTVIYAIYFASLHH